jgi:hypothetical protein
MNLIKFDENNLEHMRAFEYFAHDAGHPEYLCNDIISDYDFDFREVLSRKFNLDVCFVEEPNGCFHELVSRDFDKANFKGFYSSENDQEGCDEIGFSFEGLLFYNPKTAKVVLEPIINSIKILPAQIGNFNGANK